MPCRRRDVLAGFSTGAIALAGCASLPSRATNTTTTSPPPIGPPRDDSAGEPGLWPIEGHDAGRTGATTRSTMPDAIDAHWSQERSEAAHSTTAPVVGPNHVFIGYSESTDTNGVYDARVAGFDPKTGSERFDVEIGRGRIYGLALTADHLIAVTRGDGDQTSRLVAVTDGGTQEWSQALPHVTGPPALLDGTLYLATRGDDSAVIALASDGTEQWRQTVDGTCYNAPVVGGGAVFVGLEDGHVAALDAGSGEHRWTEPIAPDEPCCPDIQGTPTYAGGLLLVPGIDEHLYATDPADGSTVWSTRVVPEDYGNPVPSPAVLGGRIFLQTYHGGALALDAADGEVRWRDQEPATAAPPAAARDGVVFPAGDRVVARSPSGDPLWTFEMHVPDAPGAAAYIMDPEVALAHDRVYVSVHDGRVWALGSPS